MTNINVKYTSDQEEELESGYKAYEEDDHDGREDFVLKYMAKHNKTKRSVVAKLSKMGIYINRPKQSKVTGGKPVTKEKLVEDIAVKLGFEPEELEGLDKTPKLVLIKLLKRFTS